MGEMVERVSRAICCASGEDPYAWDSIARAAITAMRGRDVSEWQPIETATKDGLPILVFTGCGDGIAVVAWSACDEWQDYDGKPPRRCPTHWMPLPTKPAE